MPRFGKQSQANLEKAHPALQQILRAAIKEIDFKVLDSTRGRIAQERAFTHGFSKVHFGNSAHNYVPSIATDLFPAPYSWTNKTSFIKLSKVILRIANEMSIPIRWLGDPNRDGNMNDGWDFPHYELHPWRTWSKSEGVTLYKGH